MGSLERRLRALEVYAKAHREDVEQSIKSEVLARMTDEELEDFERAMTRACEAGGTFSDEDGPILQRAQELYAEVGRELAIQDG